MRTAGTLSAAFVLLVGVDVDAAPTEPNTLTNPLVPAMECENCHSFSNAKVHAGEPAYAPYFGWQSSLMGNAARDPIFWAGVAIADQDEPGGTEDCVRCHAPRAFLEGRGDATSIDELQPGDLEGVTCEACHRIVEDPGTPPGNAQYQIDDVVVGSIVPRRGPWTYAGPFTPPHDWLQDAYLGSSRICGTCHDVTTPRERVDDDGVGMGISFNEQRTYSEWLNSAFAADGPGFASCQDCHMPAVADMPGCQDAVNAESHPTGGRRHDLVGANRFMVQLLDAQYGDDGEGIVPSILFNWTTDRIDELLATAATVEVAGPADVDLSVGLDGLEVTVTNNTGHKLPTGYSEGRIMWLEVVASYDGAPVWTSGLWIDGQGLDRDPQVRTYEAIADEYASGTTLHLLRNDHWVTDTRLPPAGLVGDVQTDPVGTRYAMQPDGTWPNFDVAPYAFDAAPAVVDATPADPADDVLDVQVRLVYVINTRQYVQFLADENQTNDAGIDVATTFDAAGGSPPMEIAAASLQIPIVGFGATGTSGGVDDTAGPATGPSTTGPATSAGVGSEATGADAGADDDSGGCGCTTNGRPVTAGWLALGCFVLASRRRRRR